MSVRLKMSPALEKALYARKEERKSSPEDAVAELLKATRREFIGILSGVEASLDLLEGAGDRISGLIGLFEEAGGQTVRARNYLQEKEGGVLYRDKVDAARDAYIHILERIGNLITENGSGGEGNLLMGGNVVTPFDREGQVVLVTQGIALSPADLGFRPADFSDLFHVQNARVDIANALDLAMTLRNMIAGDIVTLKTRREFCETALSCLSSAEEKLSGRDSSGDGLDVASFVSLAPTGADEGEALAAEAQAALIGVFAMQLTIH